MFGWHNYTPQRRKSRRTHETRSRLCGVLALCPGIVLATCLHTRARLRYTRAMWVCRACYAWARRPAKNTTRAHASRKHTHTCTHYARPSTRTLQPPPLYIRGRGEGGGRARVSVRGTTEKFVSKFRQKIMLFSCCDFRLYQRHSGTQPNARALAHARAAAAAGDGF